MDTRATLPVSPIARSNWETPRVSMKSAPARIAPRMTQGWLPVGETPITVSPARTSTAVAVITAAVWRLKATIPCAFASPPR